ncbi:unnamed protein product [Brassica rapa subsp. trilocularis]
MKLCNKRYTKTKKAFFSAGNILKLCICCNRFKMLFSRMKAEEFQFPPTPQDEMSAGMSYFHETSWKEVLKFLRHDYTALKNI